MLYVCSICCKIDIYVVTVVKKYIIKRIAIFRQIDWIDFDHILSLSNITLYNIIPILHYTIYLLILEIPKYHAYHNIKANFINILNADDSIE